MSVSSRIKKIVPRVLTMFLQTPVWQACVDAHIDPALPLPLPHPAVAPQKLGLLAGSTQVPLQSMSVAWHEIPQTPAVQICPAVHAVPATPASPTPHPAVAPQ
jgi:hypothetical protein